MKIIRTDLFKGDYKKLPERVKKQTEKALRLLLSNLYYPSLRAKKIKNKENIWEARMTKGYRFSFQIIGDTYILRRAGKHNEILKKP